MSGPLLDVGHGGSVPAQFGSEGGPGTSRSDPLLGCKDEAVGEPSGWDRRLLPRAHGLTREGPPWPGHVSTRQAHLEDWGTAPASGRCDEDFGPGDQATNTLGRRSVCVTLGSTSNKSRISSSQRESRVLIKQKQNCT